jgi:hypothetical protein
MSEPTMAFVAWPGAGLSLPGGAATGSLFASRNTLHLAILGAR